MFHPNQRSKSSCAMFLEDEQILKRSHFHRAAQHASYTAETIASISNEFCECPIAFGSSDQMRLFATDPLESRILLFLAISYFHPLVCHLSEQTLQELMMPNLS